MRKIKLVGYTLPLELMAVTNFDELRLAIKRAGGEHETKSKTGGNRTKRLRVRIGWSEAWVISADAIVPMPATPNASEDPAVDPRELFERVARA